LPIEIMLNGFTRPVPPSRDPLVAPATGTCYTSLRQRSYRLSTPVRVFSRS
jgi:hypothetical protein